MDLCPENSEFPVETQACLHIFLIILVQISSYNYFQYFSIYKILKKKWNSGHEYPGKYHQVFEEQGL